eukprot:293521-Pyramimonas_sp.AAC.1
MSACTAHWRTRAQAQHDAVHRDACISSTRSACSRRPVGSAASGTGGSGSRQHGSRRGANAVQRAWQPAVRRASGAAGH